MFNRVYIEISNICNIQCSFCPVVERDNKIMEIEKFKDIIKQVAPITQQVCLHLMGEPLAHPKIKEILQICADEGVLVQLTTNGLLLKRYQDFLLEVGCIRQINFSLQSYKDNFPHKELHQYLKPILGFTFLAHEKRPDMYTNLRLWNVEVENGENEEIYQMVEKFYETTINRKTEVSNIKSKRVWNRVYLHFDSRFEWPSMEGEHQSDQGRCHGLISQLGIHADGTVVPCCLDKEAEINLGNAFEDSIEDILGSELALNIKSGFQNNKRFHDLCKKCSYINRFTKS